MQRYFSNSKEEIIVSPDDVHHIINVMRCRVGDSFEVVFNEKIYEMKITSIKPFGYEIVDISSKNNELGNDITLFYCLSKGDKNEFVMQKATELGVKRIVLLSSKRSIAKMSNEDFLRKKTRFEKILKEASEQSKRNIIPDIAGVYSVDKLPKDLLANHNFVAYEEDSGLTDNTFSLFSEINKNESVSILIGSEGGLAKEEISYLNSIGFKNISLGKRILRTETASIYALSVLSFFLERK